MNTEPAISIRKNAYIYQIQRLSIKNRRSLACEETRYDGWKRLNDTEGGISEIVFSSLKELTKIFVCLSFSIHITNNRVAVILKTIRLNYLF